MGAGTLTKEAGPHWLECSGDLSLGKVPRGGAIWCLASLGLSHQVMLFHKVVVLAEVLEGEPVGRTCRHFLLLPEGAEPKESEGFSRTAEGGDP